MVKTSPKLAASSKDKKKSIYKYYAGFSSEFVNDVISKVGSEATILDPWNGSGTTTEVASLLGRRSFGFDINPVMVLIAKAKLIGFGIKGSLKSLGWEIGKESKKYDIPASPDDPLLEWLYPSSVSSFRNIEASLQKILTEEKKYCRLSDRESIEGVSDLAAFFYTALFRTVRKLLKDFRSSNPTWIKSPLSLSQRLRPTQNAILECFHSNILYMSSCITKLSKNFPVSGENSFCKIGLASSKSIPLPCESIDAVITSPPYCTRIDYAIATKPELAVLGYSKKNGLDSLRNTMIGTPTINGSRLEKRLEWGETCNRFLEKIENHESKSSSSYYLKTHLQYFNDIFESLRETSRCMKPNANCVIVVQGSFYKEIQNNLPEIFMEMSGNLGWSIKDKFDFSQSRNMAALNPAYRNRHLNPAVTESVLWFQK